MTLIDRMESLSDVAIGLSSLEANRAESRRLQPLLDTAQKWSGILSDEVLQLRLLSDHGVVTSPPDSASAAIKVLAKLQTRFDKERRAEQLTQGNDWKLLEGHIDSTRKDLATVLRTEWQQFVNNGYNGESPEDLGRTLANTDRNKANLKRYQDAYSELTQLSRVRPSERKDFEYVRDLSFKLSEIFKEFDLKVHGDVKIFLRAIADGGASLDMLTPTVSEWLQDESSVDHYRIVAVKGDSL